jgi:chromate transport protein ChrA
MDLGFLLANSLEQTVWVVLLIVFALAIYTWSKGQVANKTFAVIITIVLVYLIFIKFMELVWLVAIFVIIWWIYSSDVKKWLKDNVKI